MEGRRLVIFSVAVSLLASVVANLFVWMLFVAPLLGADSQYRQMIERDRNEIARQRQEFSDWMRDEFAQQDRAALDRFGQQLAASEHRVTVEIQQAMWRIERSTALQRPLDTTQPPARKAAAAELPVIPVDE